jgi:hypothetical protein
MFEEVGDPALPAGYWSYIMPELGPLEKKWLAQRNVAAEAKPVLAAGPKNEEAQ